MKNEKYILTIAGFDPTGGAGILADIKTFRSFKLVGMAVQTANTVQTDDAFYAVNWIEEEILFQQLTRLLEKFDFMAVKIGLVPSVSFLVKVLDKVKEKNAKIPVVWDPVLSASAGVDFEQDLHKLDDVLSQITLLTPNWDEAKKLGRAKDGREGAEHLSQQATILLKGGHHPNNLGEDLLLKQGETKVYKAKSGRYSPKHGSGCVYASAIAANMAKGYPLHKSILRAKRYIEYFLSSNSSLIGNHKS